jgi:ABC-2 type transport system ATP-binding protein
VTAQTNAADADHQKALVLRGLARCYGKIEALAGIDLQVSVGETVALLGPNGAGKSTTLAIVLGLLAPSSGEVYVLGRPPRRAVADGLVGAMLQSGAGSGLPPGTRVGELVRFVASLYRRPVSPSAVLDRAGLACLAGRKVDRLSGGELQRVRFALAICADPRLLILDEPTVGLDVPARRAFWQTVGSFAAEGRAVVFATHYLAEAEEVAQRVIVIHQGRIAADGPVAEVRRTVAAKRVRFRAPDAEAGILGALPAVRRVDSSGGVITLETTDADATVRALYQSPVGFCDLEVTGAGLEEAFLALTGEDTVR